MNFCRLNESKYSLVSKSKVEPSPEGRNQVCVDLCKFMLKMIIFVVLTLEYMEIIVLMTIGF